MSTIKYSTHHRGDSAYKHKTDVVQTKVLAIAVTLTLGFAMVEFAGGLWSNSLALLGDAGHMLTDSASLLFALLANLMSRIGADRRHSFGHGRFEAMAAFVNGLTMLLVVAWLVYEAVTRLISPPSVNGESVMMIATIGLLVNVLVAWTLSKGQSNVNVKAALLHVMGDLLGSVAAIVSGLVIWMGGPMMIDPILTMFVALLLIKASLSVLKSSGQVLLDGVPEHISFEEVGDFLESIPGVMSVHDLHVWMMTPDQNAIQCHVTVTSPEAWPEILERIRRGVEKRFGIDHVTVQVEWKKRKTSPKKNQ